MKASQTAQAGLIVEARLPILLQHELMGAQTGCAPLARILIIEPAELDLGLLHPPRSEGTCHDEILQTGARALGTCRHAS